MTKRGWRTSQGLGFARDLGNGLTFEPEAEQAQVEHQHRAADHGEGEQVHRLDDREGPRRDS